MKTLRALPKPLKLYNRPPYICRITTRRLVSLRGPDATHFLQGVITANLAPSTPRITGFYAAFLNAKGRLVNDVFIYPGVEGAWLIEVDAKEADKLVKHIRRYKLRAKFDVRLGAGGQGWKEYSFGSNASSEGKGNDNVGCEDARAPGMGRRIILPGGRKPEEDVEEVGEEVYRVRRYLRGIAEGQDELIRESALPQESNGCYVGQELTIRTHHTGVVRKRILPVMLYGVNEPIPTTLEYDPSKDYGSQGIPPETSIGRFEKRGRSAGKWLAGIGNIGLGLCRLETMTDMIIQGEAGGYKEGDEFKLEWELEGKGTEIVKVKAFVPPWHPTNQ
ncbi:hypothetical protein B0O99DRAFT_610639 [Bisporella sp. PMI_857]|nr:hypothetical protein B0O99DRAFT_610639 [Bisporella sp. PMI_857]